jgi:hypothetical protein
VGSSRPLYAELAKRFEDVAQLRRGETELESLVATLPQGVRLADDIEVDHLAAAAGAARRQADAVDRMPQRWWWQRRRYRRAVQELESQLNSVIALAGAENGAALHGLRGRSGPRACLDVAAVLTQAASQESHLRTLRDRLAATSGDALADQITAAIMERDDAGRRIFDAAWRDSVNRAKLGARRAANAFVSALGAKGSFGPGKANVPAMLPMVPVWATTSLSAGSALPLHAGLFDLVIIDEAAQSDLASALPLLYRAKRAMVIGDPNQLSHITSLKKGAENRLAEQCVLTEEDAARYSYEGTSLYGRAVACVSSEPILLRRHHRSVPEIIGFANETVYHGQLIVETQPADWPSMVWIDVVGGAHRPGTRDRSSWNPAEVRAVMRALAARVADWRQRGWSVGVIAPFRPQVNRIRDEVKRDAALMNAGLAVDSVYGFQGDERDVIVLSPTIAADTPRGLIRTAGTRNQVNVAVTRARKQLVVVGDRQTCLSSSTLFTDLAQSIAEKAATDS